MNIHFALFVPQVGTYPSTLSFGHRQYISDFARIWWLIGLMPIEGLAKMTRL